MAAGGSAARGAGGSRGRVTARRRLRGVRSRPAVRGELHVRAAQPVLPPGRRGAHPLPAAGAQLPQHLHRQVLHRLLQQQERQDDGEQGGGPCRRASVRWDRGARTTAGHKLQTPLASTSACCLHSPEVRGNQDSNPCPDWLPWPLESPGSLESPGWSQRTGCLRGAQGGSGWNSVGAGSVVEGDQQQAHPGGQEVQVEASHAAQGLRGSLSSAPARGPRPVPPSTSRRQQ